MAYDLWTGDDPVATADQPMAQAFADALLTISNHPLCTDTQIEQGDTSDLWFFVQNDQTGDPTWPADLKADLASYDQAGPYRITIYLPQVQEDDSEPDDQGPTAAERNPSMLRR